jgi:sulfite exporter TauE/SafE
MARRVGGRIRCDTMNADLPAMFLLGLTGTVHCAAMCGPLVVALAGTSRGWGALAYNVGRITTYTILGGLLGAIGQHLGDGTPTGAMGPTMHAQVVLSLVSAGLLLWLGLARLGILREPGFLSNPISLFGRAGRALRTGGAPGLLVLGLLLGLLPCGLSWAAFARALAGGSAGEGALLVLAFGIGTLPGLILVGTGAAVLARRHARLADILAGILLVGMAVSLLAQAVPPLLS